MAKFRKKDDTGIEMVPYKPGDDLSWVEIRAYQIPVVEGDMIATRTVNPKKKYVIKAKELPGFEQIAEKKA